MKTKLPCAHKKTIEEKRADWRERTRRYSKSPHAKEWKRKYDKKYNASHRAEIRENKRKYRAVNQAKINERMRQWRHKNRDRERPKYLAQVNKYYSNPVKRMKRLVKEAFRRALRNGFESEKKLQEVLMMNPAVTCACCGANLDYSLGHKKGNHWRNYPYSPSLDRIDNRLGYTAKNTRVICLRCNVVKKDSTLHELKTVVAYIERELHSTAVSEDG